MTHSPEFLLDPGNAAFLAGKTTRPVADAAAATFTLIGRVILAFAVVASLICAYKLYQRLALLQEGVTAAAQVVERRVVKGRRGMNQVLDVSYRPMNGGGEIRQAALLVSRQAYERHPASSLIGIRYLPKRPDSVVQEEGFRTRPTGLARLPWIGLLLLFAVGTLGYGAWLRRRDERFGVGCQVLPGKVLRCRGESTGSGYWLHVRYEFEAPGTGLVSGTSRLVRSDLVNKPLPAQGTRVAIAFRDAATHRLL
jgi:hypothetical protein